MQKILRYKLPILVLGIAVAAAAAGLYIAGIIGPSNAPEPKHVVPPVTFTEPFVVNLADEERHYVKIKVAVQLEPMTAHDLQVFENGAEDGGGHGGGATETGKSRLAVDPTLRDAVIDTVSRFTSEQLVTPKGKEELKHALLQRFEDVAESQTLPTAAGHGKDKGVKKDAAAHDPSRPPWHIQDVYFEDFTVQ